MTSRSVSQLSVDSCQFSVKQGSGVRDQLRPAAFCPPSSVVRLLSSFFRPPGLAGPAGRISAGSWLFASTGGRREPSSYSRMTLSERDRARSENPQFLAGDGLAPAPCPLCLRGEDSCETKPIPRGALSLKFEVSSLEREGNRAKQSQFRGPAAVGSFPPGSPRAVARNNPIAPRRAGRAVARANHAKRTQFLPPGPIVRNEPKLPPDRPEGTRARSFHRVECAKRSQFQATGQDPRADCAKRSQFAPDGQGRRWGQACKTKPICPPAGREPTLGPLWTREYAETG
jgi:hypothetical protein